LPLPPSSSLPRCPPNPSSSIPHCSSQILPEFACWGALIPLAPVYPRADSARAPEMDPMDIVGKSKEDVSLPKCELPCLGSCRRCRAPKLFVVLKFDAVRCRVGGRVLFCHLNNLV